MSVEPPEEDVRICPDCGGQGYFEDRELTTICGRCAGECLLDADLPDEPHIEDDVFDPGLVALFQAEQRMLDRERRTGRWAGDQPTRRADGVQWVPTHIRRHYAKRDAT